MSEMITAAEAAVLMGRPRDYAFIQWLWRRNKLRQVKVSERKRLYHTAEVLRLAKQYAAKH
jgi:hypothetical protein